MDYRACVKVSERFQKKRLFPRTTDPKNNEAHLDVVPGRSMNLAKLAVSRQVLDQLFWMTTSL